MYLLIVHSSLYLFVPLPQNDKQPNNDKETDKETNKETNKGDNGKTT